MRQTSAQQNIWREMPSAIKHKDTLQSVNKVLTAFSKITPGSSLDTGDAGNLKMTAIHFQRYMGQQ